jgi:charged multivesicular body protein 3
MKLAGVMQKSSVVMAAMNNLVKLPQLNQIMVSMAREMEKAGLIEEIMDDVLDNDSEVVCVEHMFRIVLTILPGRGSR